MNFTCGGMSQIRAPLLSPVVCVCVRGSFVLIGESSGSGRQPPSFCTQVLCLGTKCVNSTGPKVWFSCSSLGEPVIN